MDDSRLSAKEHEGQLIMIVAMGMALKHHSDCLPQDDAWMEFLPLAEAAIIVLRPLIDRRSFVQRVKRMDEWLTAYRVACDLSAEIRGEKPGWPYSQPRENGRGGDYDAATISVTSTKW